jgi:hypothetical protein
VSLSNSFPNGHWLNSSAGFNSATVATRWRVG